MSIKERFSCMSFGASVDQQTGLLSVFEVIEELRVPKVPITLQTMVLSFCWEKLESEEFSGKIHIHHLTPANEQRKVGSGDLKVPSEQRRVKAVFRFGGFPVADYGRHRVVVSWTKGDEKKIGEKIFDLDVVQAPQRGQGVPDGEKPKVTH